MEFYTVSLMVVSGSCQYTHIEGLSTPLVVAAIAVPGSAVGSFLVPSCHFCKYRVRRMWWFALRRGDFY